MPCAGTEAATKGAFLVPYPGSNCIECISQCEAEMTPYGVEFFYFIYFFFMVTLVNEIQ